MVPAPKKPIPLTTWALMRPMVTEIPLLPCRRFRRSASVIIYVSITEIRAAPTHTNDLPPRTGPEAN